MLPNKVFSSAEPGAGKLTLTVKVFLNSFITVSICKALQKGKTIKCNEENYVIVFWEQAVLLLSASVEPVPNLFRHHSLVRSEFYSAMFEVATKMFLQKITGAYSLNAKIFVEVRCNKFCCVLDTQTTA